MHGLRVIEDDTEPAPSSPALSDAYGIALRLSEENPSDFGYPLLGDSGAVLPVTSDSSKVLLNRDNESIVVALEEYERVRESRTGGTIEPEKTLPATSKEVIDAFRAFISTTTGNVTRTEIESVKNKSFDLVVSPKFVDEAQPTGAGISPSSGRVVLTLEALSPELAEAIASQFDPDLVTIHLAKRPEGLRLLSGGRRQDGTPFYGGATIYTAGSTCSSGFAWDSSGTYPMLSAGHCAPNGDSVVTTPASSNMGEIDANTRETWNTGTGSVPLTGQTAYRGDFSMIRMASGNDSYARIYRDGNTSSSYNTVKEMWYRRANIGDTFCTGGQTTGEICGWTVHNTGYTIYYSNVDGYARPMVAGRKTSGPDTNGGDSGGSVFTERPDGYIAAKGLVSGEGGGGCDSITPCLIYFTDIWDPYYALPGQLKVG